MIKVLVVDDSLFMRKLVSLMLESDPEIEVLDTAKDGKEAMEKIFSARPDVVTLDLTMPRQDGLTTLRHIMDECPLPVIILSAHTREDADITVRCLELGAVSFITKPSGELSLDIERIKDRLIDEVKTASRVDINKLTFLLKQKRKLAVSPVRGLPLIGVKDKIIVIGSSTGGPLALEAILGRLPANFSVPIIIVQHVPSRFFSESITERLNHVCRLDVKLAEDSEAIQHGTVYIVPNGFTLSIGRERNIYLVEDMPFIISPSIDNTMRAIASTYKGNTIGVILTGMGHDGLEGARAIKENGGITIAQDESSSLVFGMPDAVIKAGYADKVLSVDEITEELVKLTKSSN